MHDPRLNALRDTVQSDVGQRGLAQHPHDNLFTALHDDFAAACHAIADHPAPHIAILTGFYIATADPPCGETDGPLGAIYLARAFVKLGIACEILADGFCCHALEVGIRVAGMDGRVKVRPLPTLPDDEVTHVIAIERVGPAGDGRCYSMRGRDITEFMQPVESLFAECTRRGIVTIGIGDGGNEIGMGRMPLETIERNIPNGRKIACRLATDHLIVAGISNWGGYALAAGITMLRGVSPDPSLTDLDLERRILQAMVDEGPLVDGKTGKRQATVDGVEFAEYANFIVELYRNGGKD